MFSYQIAHYYISHGINSIVLWFYRLLDEPPHPKLQPLNHPKLDPLDREDDDREDDDGDDREDLLLDREEDPLPEDDVHPS